jgi:hypothetical protein
MDGIGVREQSSVRIEREGEGGKWQRSRQQQQQSSRLLALSLNPIRLSLRLSADLLHCVLFSSPVSILSDLRQPAFEAETASRVHGSESMRWGREELTEDDLLPENVRVVLQVEMAVVGADLLAVGQIGEVHIPVVLVLLRLRFGRGRR